MFENIIEFSAQEDYVNFGEDRPTPIKLNIPEWYKKLEHSVKSMTVKGCMPFLDTLTTGYSLKVAQDHCIDHNVINTDTKEPDGFYKTGDVDDSVLHVKSLNLNKSRPDIHPISQLGDAPLVKKNKGLPFYKIMNPWRIKTPKGYSCLFVPPLNNSDDRFSIIPGIVDTDSFDQEINFPIVINGDKYETLHTVIKKGTPYVQVIPFKREPWKMKITKVKTEELRNSRLFYALNIIHRYKNRFWSKKSWK